MTDNNGLTPAQQISAIQARILIVSGTPIGCDGQDLLPTSSFCAGELNTILTYLSDNNISQIPDVSPTLGGGLVVLWRVRGTSQIRSVAMFLNPRIDEVYFIVSHDDSSSATRFYGKMADVNAQITWVISG